MIHEGDKWCLYQWFPEFGTNLVHPDDLDAFQRLIPNGKVFRCSESEGGFLKLQYGRDFYRVRPSHLFKEVSRPEKVFFEMVKILQKGKVLSAEVTDILWHFQRSSPFYLVSIDGKKLKKRYIASDFLS
jgi:hypothetical protein